IIVSSCSSTSDNNTGGNQDGQQTQKVTPVLKDEVDLKGSLSKIFDTTATDASSRKSTNTLISEDIKANPENYFTNGNETNVKEAIEKATIDVEGNFSNASWTGNAYNTTSNGWDGVTIEDANKLIYTTSSAQLTFKDLDGLKTELEKNETDNKTVLQNALEAAGATIEADTTLTIKNRVGFTSGDLIHINVEADKSGTQTQYDLQIPTSNLNLSVTGLTIKVSGDNINTNEKTTTNFKYNIGIDSTLGFEQAKGAAPEETANNLSDAATAAKNILVKLGYVTTTGGSDLSNDKISAALGIYNCNFTPKSATEKQGATPDAGVTDANKVYTVTVTATPFNDTYVWDDGSSGEKDFSFDVSLKVN
ncbi:hypothetical protein D8X55_04960, partial [Malacoplasma penetrans]|uniref:P35 family lipoprotein n=1 Tax=Malacoplasma penetrans TaxID=28227 RepID=UPI001011BE81